MRGGIVGFDGVFLITLDGGQPWHHERSSDRFHQLAVALNRNGETGWIVVGSGVILKRGTK
jgi:photosystem II stability/assembly factor-like uncharacterized protein